MSAPVRTLHVLLAASLIACSDAPTRANPDQGSATIHLLGATDTALVGATDTTLTGSAGMFVGAEHGTPLTSLTLTSGAPPRVGALSVSFMCFCLVDVAHYVVGGAASSAVILGSLTKGELSSVIYLADSGSLDFARVSSTRASGTLQMWLSRFDPLGQAPSNTVMVSATFDAPVLVANREGR